MQDLERPCQRITAASEPADRPAEDTEAGYSVLEVAITLPVVIMLIMLIFQAAVIWFARGVAQDTARQGLRAAQGYQATAQAGHDRAAEYLQQVAPGAMTNPHITVTRGAATVSVKVTSHVPNLVPFTDFTVHATATGPIETYRSAP
jgi:type II secretory pathway pseudopilin PulG